MSDISNKSLNKISKEDYSINCLDYEKLSPMMQQYFDIKETHKEYLLFFRMGDFYEMFFDDAIIASKVLGVVLTKRLAGNGQEAPMCGVPVHSYENYLHRLIKGAYNVAICDQLESPEEAKKRGVKEIVKRGVVRIITPGTITEEFLLEGDAYNYLACIIVENKKISVSWIDISSGDFYVESALIEDINSLLYKIQPKEILTSEELDKSFLSDDFKLITTEISKERFEYTNCLATLKKIFAQRSFVLDSLEKLEKISCGVLLYYIELTQKNFVSISAPKKDYSSKYVRLDAFTRNSLEILSSYSGNKQGSLRFAIDCTKTSQGSRMLSLWITNPLRDVVEINERLDIVSFFRSNLELLSSLRDTLKNIPDVERALGRIMLKKSSIVEIVTLRAFLRNILKIKQIFFRIELPKKLLEIMQNFDFYGNLLNKLNDAIAEHISGANKDTGFIKDGYSNHFDEVKIQKDNLLLQIISLQEKYIVTTGISNLKVIYNSTSGYFIEIQSKYASQINQNSEFIHKQTMASMVRYTTEELILIESEILKTNNLTLSLEKDIFNLILAEIIEQADSLQNSSKALASLDVLSSFAKLAIDYNLSKPIVDNSALFTIENGRHLVVEKSIKKKENSFFVPNSCNMVDKNIFLITGPNMAGKSTYLRQNALLIIMAQSGCFVPAQSAHIGVCDAIFSRVGASDDLFKGQSTFMVEMLELATILNYATDKSFIILDEIGRGTSTYDGLSIAWSTLEYINNKLKARTLFATHYHELIELEKKIDLLECYYVQVLEEQGRISFMHSVIKGAVSKSYGIEVAKIAGLPNNVIKNAQSILTKLEKTETENLPLFDFVDINFADTTNNIEETIEFNDIPVVNYLNEIEVDNLTPKQALDVVYELKSLLKKI